MFNKLGEYFSLREIRFVRRQVKQSNVDKVVVLGTPKHGNLGDQAIAYAQKQFIRKNFPNLMYVEIPAKEILVHLFMLRRVLRPGRDVVLYHGGGNMGDLYPKEEKLRHLVLKVLGKKMAIVSFPQTIFSQKDSILSKKDIYKKTPNWVFTFREQASYAVAQKRYGSSNEILLVPDIVLSLPRRSVSLSDDIERSGVITLLRSDLEMNRDENRVNDLLSYLSKRVGPIQSSDTHIGHSFEVNQSNRERLLMQKWSEISKRKLVVTDRLHGMIFAYLTNTPVIVLNINNYKIKSTYLSWLRNQSGILFTELKDESEIESFVNTALDSHENFSDLNSNAFRPLVEAIKRERNSY